VSLSGLQVFLLDLQSAEAELEAVSPNNPLFLQIFRLIQKY
jgi:hypothetical protein